jgi:nucleoside-diphosphate-sugar epimerase
MTETPSLHRAFVTGGSGFIGHQFLTYLRQRGVQVRALARSESAIRSVRQAGAEPVQGDLDDERALVVGMTGCDVVFHLAAKASGWAPYEDFYHTNVVGTQHVLEAARTAAIPRLVHVSTEAVFTGQGPIRNVDETRPRSAHPAGPYGRTKGLAEELVEAANCSTLTTVIVRPRLVWGKQMPALAQIVRAVRAGSFPWIEGGHYLTSSCHVGNVCEGLWLAAHAGRGGESYFLTDGPPREFRQFFTMLLQTQGVMPGNQNLPRWLARTIARLGEWAWSTLKLKGEPPLTMETVCLVGEEVTVNDAKARRELGYQATISFEAGVAMMKIA